MKLGIQLDGIDAVRDLVSSFSDRRIRATAATALTRTAREIEAEWTGEIFSEIDRPTSWTARAVSVKTADAQDLHAEVFIKDQPTRPEAPAPVDWLSVQEEGGSRYIKKFERALMRQGAMPQGHKVVPGKYAQLDSFGNISRSQIVQVVTQLGTDFSPGYARVISPKVGKRIATAKKRGLEFVAFTKRGRGQPLPGVYQRVGRELHCIFLYLSTVTYRKRIDLQEIANRRAPVILAGQFGRALGEQIMRLGKVSGTARIDE